METRDTRSILGNSDETQSGLSRRGHGSPDGDARRGQRPLHLRLRPREDWKSKEELEKKLTGEGWEVYAIDAEGSRVEAYFHPVTLKNVYTGRR